MLDIDFTYDGWAASNLGIKLQSPISFSKAVPRVQTIQIAGRNGDLHIDEGAYNNRVGTANCYIMDVSINETTGKLNANVTDRMAYVMAYLFQSRDKGYLKLQTSDDPDHYWRARVANAGELAPRLGLLNPFTIEFDCMPYRYTNDAETIITIGSAVEYDNPTGFSAYPILYVEASNAGVIQNDYGGIEILEAGQYIIDLEDGRALGGYYDGETIHYLSESADNKISANTFPYIPAWGGGFSFDDTLSIQMAPRWRTL